MQSDGTTERLLAISGQLCRLLLVVMLLALSTACLSRSRLNSRCEWVEDAYGALDLQRLGDRQHLSSDVELAEELGIRFGDSFRRQFGRIEEHIKATDCQGRLFQTIGSTHGLTAADVQTARSTRPVIADATTLLLFAALYSFGGWKLTEIIRSSPAFASFRARTIAYGVASLAASALGLLCLNMAWVPAVEIVRTGNMHRSLRVAASPWPHHLGSLFVGGVVTFALMAAMQQRPKRGITPHAVDSGRDR